ncbi:MULTISPECIES: zinc ABC transporter ATP-binding protein ZnuC [Marinobacter]|uniref:Zinc ABC transporter ATP-binding protein ZnuC n=1 Tax=Marinobacter xiaoshiensis TaxID=3073652 RepID=A0ABU2HIK7_9GAMM|nr:MULTISPECIES: zinc ABC transporter ATP-binding protein ZnuC [unclassified Marinobacter]MBK1873301.1 zinc ABC transporter ATP-binding protein ZnuC [Marinobacter sp. 1-3A]MBK1886541.1 zinc ABC transporter ATP-binding protein ZnuC [Marinobacter sp. DY40_1A1]MDS1310857.1 zinc ABC transporter ATP-binding protein ZnuC [Marinobacter sp. F60267]
MDEPLVDIKHLTVRFDDRPVVDRVSLTLYRGDIITIIGPNGAGKTTLIKAVLGIQAATSGHILRAKDLVIGYVPQHLSLESTLPLSIQRFMLLSGQPLAACIAALERTGVGHLLKASVHHLSGGEQQRLLLARALVRKPDLLVLDEPAQGVDINGQAALYDLIRQLRDELNCGVIMISHDLHLVMAATDKVICLNQHVCCSGHPADISHDPAFIETFGRPVAESLAVYHHHHNHSHDLSGNVVGTGHPGSATGHGECNHEHH